jgi:hypothetical protein
MSSPVTSHAFAELLKVADNAASDLKVAGPPCQVPVILSVMAIEALINDMEHLACRVASAHNGARAFAELSKTVHGSRVRPRLQLMMYCLTGESMLTDRDPYQAFNALVELRNAYVHAGPEEWFDEGGKKRPKGKVPSCVQFLLDRKIVDDAVTYRDSWKPEVAHWAVRVAGDVVLHALPAIGRAVPALGFVAACLIQPHFDPRHGPPAKID